MASGGIAQGPNSKPVNTTGKDYNHPDNKPDVNTSQFKPLPKDERFTPENEALKSQFKPLPKDERFTPENKAAKAKAKK